MGFAKFLLRLATLPAKLVLVVCQYFTTGTVFKNEVIASSLKRTVNCALFQHMGPGLFMGAVKLSTPTIDSIFAKFELRYGQLPGYGSNWEGSVNARWVAQAALSDPVLLYIHGGCFAIQLQDCALEAMANIYLALDKYYSKKISVLILDYTLTSQGARYPKQCNEVFEVYQQLLAQDYKNIIVMGDSAGGNLTMTLLQDLRPKDNIVWPRGVISMSPWLNTTHAKKTGSYLRNDSLDVFSFDMVNYFGAEYVDNQPTAFDNDPRINISSAASEFRELPTLEEGRVLFIFGENEVLYDEIITFLEDTHYKAKHPDRVYIDSNGVHIGFFIAETVDYHQDLSSWANMPCARAILTFIDGITNN